MEKTAEKQEQLKSLETEKAQMIARYMSLQDQADALNEEIYKVCCGVEALNRQIKTIQKALKKAAARAGKAPANGASHPPANGNAH